MEWLKNLKSNKSALRTFVLLITGFVLIQIAGIYVTNVFVAEKRYQVTRSQLATDLIHVIMLLNLIPESVLRDHPDLLVQHGINRVVFANHPLKNGALIERTDDKYLRWIAFQYYFDFHVSYQLADGEWVIMHGGAQQTPFLFAGFIISEFFLLMVLILLCIWVVQRLAMPLIELERAIKRFGVDLQSPPMAVQGIPEMQLLILAFNQMQGRIRRLVADRTQLLVAVSHDLRTPLTRLYLRIEALEDVAQYEKAENDLTEMERMIASILSLARDNSRTEAMEWFDLRNVLENTCHELVDTGMRVSFGSDVPVLSYFGRLVSLKRALINLIENAVKYGHEANVSLESFVDQVKIKIRDQGPGIPREEMERVFAPFYRVNPDRTPEKSGTGLGMAVAREVIRAHGGDITLYNHEAGGLLVLVVLPINTP